MIRDFLESLPMPRIRAVGCPAIAAVAVATWSQTGRTSPKVTSLTASCPHYKVVVKQKLKSAVETAGCWGLFEGETNKRCVALQVTFDKEAVDVPLSVYGDRANVNRVTAAPTKGGCSIKIDGADAGSGYNMVLRLKGASVISREVHDGEFPDNYWEKTTYHEKEYKG